MKKILEKVKSNKVKQILMTTLLFAIIIVAYFEINVLTEKLNIKDIDMTESKLYSLTNETKEKIKGIDKKLEIQLINFDEYLYSSDISNSVDVINQYAQVNNNISVSQISDSEVMTPSIVFKYDDKTKTISIDDLYTYEFSDQTYIDENLDVTEEAITNAISEITANNNKKIYIYIEHSAYKDYPDKYFATLINKIDNKLNDMYYLELSTTASVPDDCDCLIIPTLGEDISEIERDAIISYIKNGGNILLLQESYGILNLDLPNFQSVIDLYGISFSKGIIMEQSSDNMINNIPEFISVKVNSDSKIGKCLNDNSKLLLIDSGKIDFKDNDTLNSLNVTYEVIAETSESSFLRNDLSITDSTILESDQSTPNAILSALVTKKVDDDKNSELIVFSNSIFATDSNIPVKDTLTGQNKTVKAIYFNNNEEILENSIKYLSNNNNSLILRKKYYDNIPTVKLIKSGSLIQILYGIPMLIILIGYIVWRVRKNKK